MEQLREERDTDVIPDLPIILPILALIGEIGEVIRLENFTHSQHEVGRTPHIRLLLSFASRGSAASMGPMWWYRLVRSPYYVGHYWR